jgi:hypothetical protein
MEYALRGDPRRVQYQYGLVLILVLMEYALRDLNWPRGQRKHTVLILVLMEYALRVCLLVLYILLPLGLNPCFNGVCPKGLFPKKTQSVLIWS